MKNINSRHRYACLLSLSLICCLLSFPLSGQEQRTALPSIYLYTDGNVPVVSKTEYVPGRIIIKSSDVSEELDVTTEIRGRGNSTWDFAKKPYRIKLTQKHNILNLPAKAKSWTLLANHADKTLMRNAVAFKISELTGLEFSPSARFVDLVLNDEFLGNYMLSDQIQVHKHRVNVDELLNADTDPDIITGGYLLEIDGFAASEPVWFATAYKDLKITVKSPDDKEINSQQLNYIKGFVNEFERRLFADNFTDPVNGYRPMVDTLSLINWYICCELTGNSDSFWSTYLYKKRGIDKLFFGPMWDYDIAFNNDDRLGDATRKLMRENAHNPRTWIEQLYQDKWFQLAVMRRWNELVANNLLGQLTGYVDELAAMLGESQRLNFDLWGSVRNKVYREQYLFRTYALGVDYLKTYLTDRVDFLTGSFATAEPPRPSVAFVADSAYYMIMSKKSKNVIDVQNESPVDDSPLVLWEPKNDDDGQLWELVSAGNDMYHIVNKQSGLVIAGNGKGNNLVQKTKNNTDNTQKWKVVPVNTGNVYCLLNVASGFSMNNSGGRLENGNAVIEYDNGINYDGEYPTVQSENRQWYLQKMEMKKSEEPQPPVSVQSLSQQNVALYPNPAVDKVYIQFAPVVNNVTISIHNLPGEKVFEKQYSGKQTVEIPVYAFNAGMYILRVCDDNELNVTKKILIK